MDFSNSSEEREETLSTDNPFYEKISSDATTTADTFSATTKSSSPLSQFGLLSERPSDASSLDLKSYSKPPSDAVSIASTSLSSKAILETMEGDLSVLPPKVLEALTPIISEEASKTQYDASELGRKEANTENIKMDTVNDDERSEKPSITNAKNDEKDNQQVAVTVPSPSGNSNPPSPLNRRVISVKDKFHKCLNLAMILLLVFILFIAIGGYAVVSVDQYEFPNDLNYHVDISSLRPLDESFTGDYNVFLNGRMGAKEDGAILAPKQNVDWAIASGYNAIIVADKTLEASNEAINYAKTKNSSLIVIPAVSIVTRKARFTAISVTSEISICGDGNGNCEEPSVDDIRGFIEKVHSAGGIVSVSLFESRPSGDPISLDSLFEIGADAVEVTHQEAFDLPAYQKAKLRSKAILSSSYVQDKSLAAYSWTILKVQSMDVASIISEIKSKRTTLLYDGKGISSAIAPNMRVSLGFQAVSPLYYLGKLQKAFVYSDNTYTSGITVSPLSIFMFFVYFGLAVTMIAGLLDFI